MTRQKLGQAVPVIDIAIDAGLNARLLSTLISDAENLYRGRFLREKQNLTAVDGCSRNLERRSGVSGRARHRQGQQLAGSVAGRSVISAPTWLG